MGREGRQASSFSDFAIGEFRFLRRLLFWHGSNFGYNMVNFMCLLLLKQAMESASKAIYSLWAAAYSGMDFIDVLFFLLYAVILTQYGWYVWNEQQISKALYADDETKLKFELCEFYSMVRDNFIKRVKRRVAVFTVATYWAGFWGIYIVWNTLSGTVDSSGKALGIYDIGFAT